MAGHQYGVVTVGQLHTHGLDQSAIAHRTRSGRLHPLHRGVYAVGHRHLPREGRFLAAVLAMGPGAQLSHRSAATLWELLAESPGAVDVMVTRKARPRAGIRVHTTGGLRRAERTRRAGIPVTSPERTLLDLAAAKSVSAAALRRAVREAFVRRIVDEGVLRAQLERAGGRRGAARLAEILRPGAIATRSELEDRTLDVLRAHGFPQPAVNATVGIGSRTYEVDFLFVDRRLVVEADGARFHDTPVSRRDDVARQATLEAAGYRVVRVTWDQVTRETAQTVRRLRAAYGAPGGGSQAQPPTSPTPRLQ